MREGDIRIPSGCAIAGIFEKSGRRVHGETIIRSIAVMHERSNGLGGGFAAYGIYPQYESFYAFHVFYESPADKKDCEFYLKRHFAVIHQEKIPTRKTRGITDVPLIWRYFLDPLPRKRSESQLDEQAYVVQCLFQIHRELKGAYVFSSGKNMGVFKAVGYPEDVGTFYRLETYEGYCFLAHGRYPTNTPGWWGGAHPFALLDRAVVHNGEISSYDANRRAIEMYGYRCALLTDTEVITYIIDYLQRKIGLTLEETASVIAAPLWQDIEEMEPHEREKAVYLRHMFASQLITGPFSVLIGFSGGLMALNDRLKLRSMVVGEKGDTVYIASEEAAIRSVAPVLDSVYHPKGGQPVIFSLNGDL